MSSLGRARTSPLACCLIACGLLSLGATAATAAPADLDLSFGGGDGIAPVEPPPGRTFSTTTASRMAVGPQDEVFVLYASVGDCPSVNSCQVDWSVGRYPSDGSRDPFFGQGPGSSLSVRGVRYWQADLAVGPDGKQVVAALDQGGLVLARFDFSGRLDGSFGGDGRIEVPGEGTLAGTPPVVGVQPDGKIVVAVEAGLPRGVRIARYLPDGTPDPSFFGPGGQTSMGMGSLNRPVGLLFGADGTIAFGLSDCCGGRIEQGPAIGFGRFHTNGELDHRFLFHLPTQQPSELRSVASTADGGIVAALDEGQRGAVIAKVGPGASVNPGFGVAGGVLLSQETDVISASDLAVDSRGRIVGVGWSGAGVWAYRLQPNGKADRTFNGGHGVRAEIDATQETASAVVLQSGDRVVALGESTCCGAKTMALVRFQAGDDRSRCLKRKATIVGTRGPDELTGTPRRDVIAALAGRDVVRGLSGRDVICGGRGKDRLFGGPGRDRVRQ